MTSNQVQTLNMFTQIRPRRGARLYELVAEQVEEMILSGQLASGDRLPSEAELGAQFSVSRTVVREAIKVLTDKGLVRPEPGRGTFVARPDVEVLVTSMDTILRIEQCTLADVLELRQMIEVPAAGLAAKRSRAEDRAAMRSAYEGMEDGKLIARQFLLADKAFHVALARATGNELVVAMVGALMELCWKLQLVPLQTYPDSMPHHRQILEAVVAGQRSAAQKAMAAHHNQISATLSAVAEAGRAVAAEHLHRLPVA
jgi:GntR family transcriptional repressor for pyruvate dehydrogenase complex